MNTLPLIAGNISLITRVGCMSVEKAPTATDKAPTTSAPVPPEMSRECFEYMMKHDIPSIVDGVCKLLFQTMPEDPSTAVAQHFTAQRYGLFHGGMAIAGVATSGGWLRVYNCSGGVSCSIDRIPMQQDHGEIQWLCGSAKDNHVFIVSSPAGSDDKSDGPPGSVTNSCVRKYDAVTGQLLDTYDCGKAISAILCHREKNHIWIFFKAGGCVVLQTSNGAQIREISNTPPSQAAAIRQNSLYLLTLKSIERRDIDTLQLEHVMHLPDSMMKPTTFVLNQRHLWCASANPDGSANFIGIYDGNGRPVSTFLPPPASMIAIDSYRGGTWHLPKQSTSNGQIVFANERGSKVITCELGRFKKANVVVDKGTGMLWLFRVDEDKCRVGLYNPYQQTFAVEHATPDTVGTTTFMTAL